MSQVGLFREQNGAEFSPCRAYRYRLWRKWDSRPPCCFVMLNPSTADETVNDPTVTRCERRARDLGHGGLVVVNLFAFRATDPAAMKAQADPIGPLNDEHIRNAAGAAGRVICAWGEHGRHMGRGWQVRAMLHDAGIRLQVLAFNASGEPKHPLYVASKTQPMDWEETR